MKKLVTLLIAFTIFNTYADYRPHEYKLEGTDLNFSLTLYPQGISVDFTTYLYAEWDQPSLADYMDEPNTYTAYNFFVVETFQTQIANDTVFCSRKSICGNADKVTDTTCPNTVNSRMDWTRNNYSTWDCSLGYLMNNGSLFKKIGFIK